MFKPNGVQRWITFLVFLLTCSCPLVFGQVQTGEILGDVTDNSGAVVPGATVTVTDVGTGSARQVKTDGEGRYAVPDLQIGDYQVRVEMTGFSVQTQNGLVLAIGQSLVTNFKLQVGTVSQEVTVATTTGAPINTVTSETGGLVGGQQIEQLPLNGRNYQQLFSLVPGVNLNQVTSGGANFGATPRFSVAGARTTVGSFLLDGVEIRTFWGSGGGTAILGTSLGVESIAEFRTLTSNFSAEYAGVYVENAVTRSGTNNLHGSGYGFFRNSVLNTRNFFDPATGPEPFHQNQFGGAVGGPIKKNKTFFFANYEGWRASQAKIDTEDLPNANSLNGILPCSQAMDYCNPGTGLATVPILPSVRPFLPLYATPANAADIIQLSDGEQQFFNYGNEPESENYVTGKVDQVLSEKNTVSIRYVLDHATDEQPWVNGGSGENPIGITDIQHDNEQNQYLTLQDRHVFSPSLVNVGTVSFVRTNQQSLQDTSSAPAQDSVMDFVPGAPGHALGNIAITNVSTIGSGTAYYPLFWIQNYFTEQDEVDWVHGAHDFKFGGSVARIQCNCSQVVAGGDYYSFLAGASGTPYSAWEAFLRAEPYNLTGLIPGLTNAERGARQTNISGFVQDDWRVLKRLTLNLGLRDDFITNPTEAHNLIYRVTNFDPFNCGDNPACDNGVIEAGDSTGWTQEPHYWLHNPSTHNIDPRVGFAWDVFGDGKSAFRASFGLFHSIIYPREYVPGMSYAYPQVQGRQNVFTPTNTFPTASLVLEPYMGRSQTDWSVYHTPYEEEWSASLEQQIPWGLHMTLTYVGSNGVHLVENQEMDSNIPEVLAGGTQYRPACASVPGALQYGCTPNVAFGEFLYQNPVGNSHYNGGTVNVVRNVGRGVVVNSAYTYAKCIDFESSGLGGVDVGNDSSIWVQPNLPGRFNKGFCAFNITNNWTSSVLLPLPFHGNRLKDGWQVSFISVLRSGNPETPTIGFDRANLDEYFNAAERPDVTPGFTGQRFPKTQTEWFNPSAFQLPAAGYIDQGYASRDSIPGPGEIELDTSLTKSTKLPKLGEAAAVQLRADAFNAPNHANFGEPTSSVFSSASGYNPTAGLITSTATTSRQMQLSVRVVF